jgi:hypothetical protein
MKDGFFGWASAGRDIAGAAEEGGAKPSGSPVAE